MFLTAAGLCPSRGALLCRQLRCSYTPTRALPGLGWAGEGSPGSTACVTGVTNATAALPSALVMTTGTGWEWELPRLRSAAQASGPGLRGSRGGSRSAAAFPPPGQLAARPTPEDMSLTVSLLLGLGVLGPHVHGSHFEDVSKSNSFFALCVEFAIFEFNQASADEHAYKLLWVGRSQRKVSGCPLPEAPRRPGHQALEGGVLGLKKSEGRSLVFVNTFETRRIFTSASAFCSVSSVSERTQQRGQR